MSKPKYSLGQITVNLVGLDMLVEKKGWCPRYDFGDMKTLTNSIREHGVIQPLFVHRNKEGLFEVLNGYRRLRALKNIKKSGKEAIEVPIVQTKQNDVEADWLLRCFAEAGKPYLPYEEAGIFSRLQEMSQGEFEISAIARSIGKSQAYVKDRLSLIKAVPTVVAMLKKGEVSLAAVQRIVKVADTDEDKQALLLEQEMKNKGATQEALEEHKKEEGIKRVRLRRDNIKEENRGHNRLWLKMSKTLLADASDAYAELIQARLPINNNNKYWKRMQKVMGEIRNLKKEGVLKV